MTVPQVERFTVVSLRMIADFMLSPPRRPRVARAKHVTRPCAVAPAKDCARVADRKEAPMIARKAGPVRSVLALVSGFLLAGATQPAFGKRLGPFHDCAGMCSLEFMKGASSDTITAGLSNNPAARRYLRDMLWFAVKVDNAGAVEALLRAGAPPNSLEYYSNGRFLLQVAAARGNKRIVSLLLTAGAFPNAAGPEGGRPLHAAAGFGRVDVVAALLAAGRRPASIGSPRHDNCQVCKKKRQVLDIDELGLVYR